MPVLVALVAFAQVCCSHAQLTRQLLASFSNVDGGPSMPWELVQSQTGSFYAVSGLGGSNNVGTIFRVDSDGTVNTMITFGGSIGDYPQEGLIQASDGNFYGTTYQSAGQANGSIFRMTPEGAFTTLHWFDCSQGEGIGPICRLMQTPGGILYGTTYYGGTSGCMGNSAGTVFRITTNGVFSTVISFDGTNGANPQCGLILGSDGALYGSTTGGGGLTGDAYGTIFRLNTNGLLSTLHTFNVEVDGSRPSGTLLLANDGNFYGTTEFGTNNDSGTIFRMTPGGALATLVQFNGRNGQYPHGDLLQARDGFIYGRTIAGGLSDHGTIFRLTTNGAFATILHFDGSNGAGPWAAPVLGLDGNIYGTTASGGPGDGGVAFRLVPPPRMTQLTRSNEVVAVTWSSFTKGVYQLELSTDLNATSWIPVGPQIIGKVDATTQVTTNQTKGQSFYRVALLPWLR